MSDQPSPVGAGNDREPRRCWPWRHDWDVRRVTVPMFDMWAKGILKTCRICGKVVAK